MHKWSFNWILRSGKNEILTATCHFLFLDIIIIIIIIITIIFFVIDNE